jgi:hypothetical protein
LEARYLEHVHPYQSQGLDESPSGPFRGRIVDAIRFWEPRRLVYNSVLIAATLVWLALTLHSLLLLAVLALLANGCYCAAYLVDIPMQRSSFRNIWRRRRSVLWLMGTLFAFVVANYWIADEIYPFVH